MLTARDAVGDRVGGLDAGADDYLLKPFTAHPRVDEEADRSEHDRHSDGERKRQAEADWKPAQVPPSLRRR